MLFTAPHFAVFIGIVFLLYFLCTRSYRLQNIILLIASYIFYGYWDWRFCLLLAFTTSVDFFAARAMEGTDDPGRKRLLLGIPVITNLCILGFFKYFNFFTNSTIDALNSLGIHASHISLHIVLPVGMSFYIFKEISYIVDVYRGKQPATNDFLNFALYVSFFAHLVAGPIERVGHLLPQISQPRKISISEINAGLYLILFGYFQKMVIADNLGTIADPVFDHFQRYHGLDILLAILAYTFQIYCDFAGYSNIARGISKIMGFDLVLNFRLPYFALSPSDFWERWHISLSSWLRDYLYISLGGNRKGTWFTYRNLILTMLLGGLWHGASWHFVLWGGYHGLILVLYRIFDKQPATDTTDTTDTVVPNFSDTARKLLKMALMFVLTMIGWVIFRAKTFAGILYMLSHVGFSVTANTMVYFGDLLLFVAPLLVLEIIQYRTGNLLIVTRWNPVVRGLLYGCFLLFIVLFGLHGSTEFIYFQF